MSSRFLTGIPLNSRLVERIGELELTVRHILKLGEEHSLRVRHLGNQEARVEISAELFPFSAKLEKRVKNAVESFGYREILFAPYRRGSVSTAG